MKKIGHTQKAALMYIAKYPQECEYVTSAGLAEKIAEGVDAGVQSVYQSILRLTKDYMVLVQHKPHSKSKSFFINWNSKNLPEEVFELAPPSVKEVAEAEAESVSTDPFDGGDSEEFKWHDAAEFTEKLADDDSDVEEPETKPEPVQVQEAVATENAVTVEPTVVKTADGRSISINLTINLNL